MRAYVRALIFWSCRGQRPGMTFFFVFLLIKFAFCHKKRYTMQAGKPVSYNKGG